MTGDAVKTLQEKLRRLGYPVGNIDGVFGNQMYRGIVLFQADNGLTGEPGVWLSAYDAVLAHAEPMLPAREKVTHTDLDEAGDKPVKHMNLFQRIFAWLFGASAVAQTFDGASVLESVQGVRGVIDPVQDVIGWVATNRFLLVAIGCVAAIVLVRKMRAEHVKNFQDFSYQGPPPPAMKAATVPSTPKVGG